MAKNNFWAFMGAVEGARGEKRYSLSEAAKMVGRSQDTLLRWEKDNDVVLNSEEEFFGTLPVRIFTEDDIRRLQALVATGSHHKKSGRPRKET